MHFFVFAFLLTGIFTPSVSSVEYQTISIFSKQYLAASDWGEIPLDPQGEDVNSERFGKVYYPPSILGTQKKEPRKTMARGKMEVELDLLNQTQNIYIMSGIKLEIKGTYDATPLKTYKGDWELGSRTSSFRPEFVITGEKPTIVVPVEDQAIWPPEEYMESRFIFDVLVEDNELTAGKIYAYTFQVHFFNADNPEETVQVASDKVYFIAAR